MSIEQLAETAQAMVAPGKGVIAIDESTRTIGKRFADVGLEKPLATLQLTLKDGAKRDVSIGATAEGSSRWAKVSGSDDIWSISSWAADWAMAEEKKFQKEKDKDKKDKKPDAAPGGMPPGATPDHP